MELEYGTIRVKCDSTLYGINQIELDFCLHQEDNQDFSNDLIFIQEHYAELYSSVLSQIFSDYLKNPNKWNIWDEETSTPVQIEFSKKEELHSYIGIPTLDIMSHEDKVLMGLSFWKNNMLSIEHGLCAVFHQHNLLLIDATDFENILNYWKFYEQSTLIQ